MPGVAQMIAWHAGQLGNDGRPYTRKYGWPDDTAWCALYQSAGSDAFGKDSLFKASASVSGVVGQLRRIPDTEARAGDYVGFNWDGREDLSWMDHIGIVEWSAIKPDLSGYFGTIEGNTAGGGTNLTSVVARMTRNNQGGYFTAFFRPTYVEPAPTPAYEINPGGYANELNICYQAHVADLGWLGRVRDGRWAGTKRGGIRMEAIRIDLSDTGLEGDVELEVTLNVQNIGQLAYRVTKDGMYDADGKKVDYMGTVGKGLRIELITIRVAKNATGYRFNMQVHAKNLDDSGVIGLGHIAKSLGSIGEARQLEAFRFWAES